MTDRKERVDKMVWYSLAFILITLVAIRFMLGVICADFRIKNKSDMCEEAIKEAIELKEALTNCKKAWLSLNILKRIGFIISAIFVLAMLFIVTANALHLCYSLIIAPSPSLAQFMPIKSFSKVIILTAVLILFTNIFV